MMRTYKGRPSVVLREIHGSYFLIDTTARVEHDTSVIYQLDPMGHLSGASWQMLPHWMAW